MTSSGYHSSAVRQIVINVNASNWDESKYRPVILFYQGPEKFDPTSPVRDSLPVILYLKENFRGVLFMPNSPVVIVGNNKEFKGFIVAKSFVQLDTEGYELQQKDGYYLKDGKTYYKQTDYGFDMYIDEWGNVQYQKDAAGNYIEVQPTIDATSQFGVDPSLTLEGTRSSRKNILTCSTKSSTTKANSTWRRQLTIRSIWLSSAATFT